jgi:hypothetical protein
MNTTHSDKALKTIAMMGTVPGDWYIPEIDWVEENRMVIGLVTCPVCQGNKRVAKDASGAPKPWPSSRDYGAWSEYERAAREQCKKDTGRSAGWEATNCDNCKGKIGRYGHGSTGQVKSLVERLVRVGYVRWPAGVKFDSRFTTCSGCQLCAKEIRKSWRVPVAAKGADGSVHGMWVGSDCGRKFLSAEIKETAKAGGEIAAIEVRA